MTTPPAAPGGDTRAEAREQITRAISLRRWSLSVVTPEITDAVLAKPAVAAALDLRQRMTALADEWDAESRDAMQRSGEARRREDRTMYAVNVRHSRVLAHAAGSLRRALDGES